MQQVYDVFISYSRKDYMDQSKNIIPGNVISKLMETFDANGITYWIDKKGIYCGDAFAKIITRNIKSAKLFVFVSSENSNLSEWTSNEIAVANQYKKKIIPFRIDDSTYNDDVILFIAKLDFIDYTLNPEQALKDLVSSINNYKQTLAEKEIERQKALELARQKAKEEEEEKKRLEEEKKRQQELQRQAEIEKKRQQLDDEINQINSELAKQQQNLSDLEGKKERIMAELNEAAGGTAALKDRHKELLSKREQLKKQLETEAHANEIPEQKPAVTEEVPTPKNPDTNTIDWQKYFNKYFGKVYLVLSIVILILCFCDIDLVGDFPIWLLLLTLILLFLSHKYTFGLSGLKSVLIYLGLPFFFYLIGSFIVLGSSDNQDTLETEESTTSYDGQENLSSLEFMDLKDDRIYGIEVSQNLNWDSLYFRFIGEKNEYLDNKCHNVAFVLVRATEGMTVKNENYQNIRSAILKNGSRIKIASYHVLDVYTESHPKVTGANQADNYLEQVGRPGDNDLPPVLSVVPNKETDFTKLRERCEDWIKQIKIEYKKTCNLNVKPIIFLSLSTYNDIFKGHKEIDAYYWIANVADDSSNFIFVKDKNQKVMLYNGHNKLQDTPSDNILSEFMGNWGDFSSLQNLQ